VDNTNPNPKDSRKLQSYKEMRYCAGIGRLRAAK
jgi:hypothetical protein